MIHSKRYKSIIILSLFIFFISCDQSDINEKKEVLKRENRENFDYLLGDWKRINDKKDHKTYESWIKLNDDEYQGHGYTIFQSDTVFKEDIRIIKKKSEFYFEVRGVNDSTTFFLITEISEHGFICRNEENDFPKKIEYQRKKDTLQAIISDDNTSIQFTFEER